MSEICQNTVDFIIRKKLNWLEESPMAIKTADEELKAITAVMMTIREYNESTGSDIDPEKDNFLAYAKAAASALAEISPTLIPKTAMDWEEFILREAPQL